MEPPPTEEDNTSSRLDRIEAILEQLMLQSRRPGGNTAATREPPTSGASDQEQGGGGHAEGGNTPDRSARAGGPGDVTTTQPSQPHGRQEERSLQGAAPDGGDGRQQMRAKV